MSDQLQSEEKVTDQTLIRGFLITMDYKYRFMSNTFHNNGITIRDNFHAV